MEWQGLNTDRAVPSGKEIWRAVKGLVPGSFMLKRPRCWSMTTATHQRWKRVRTSQLVLQWSTFPTLQGSWCVHFLFVQAQQVPCVAASISTFRSSSDSCLACCLDNWTNIPIELRQPSLFDTFCYSEIRHFCAVLCLATISVSFVKSDTPNFHPVGCILRFPTWILCNSRIIANATTEEISILRAEF